MARGPVTLEGRLHSALDGMRRLQGLAQPGISREQSQRVVQAILTAAYAVKNAFDAAVPPKSA